MQWNNILSISIFMSINPQITIMKMKTSIDPSNMVLSLEADDFEETHSFSFEEDLIFNDNEEIEDDLGDFQDDYDDYL